MEVKYIVAIVAGAIFAAMFIICVAVWLYTKHKQKILRESITKMYNDPALGKMEYDFAAYDEETNRILNASNSGGQITIDDIIENSAENEGLEEITGNYKP